MPEPLRSPGGEKKGCRDPSCRVEQRPDRGRASHPTSSGHGTPLPAQAGGSLRRWPLLHQETQAPTWRGSCSHQEGQQGRALAGLGHGSCLSPAAVTGVTRASEPLRESFSLQMPGCVCTSACVSAACLARTWCGCASLAPERRAEAQGVAHGRGESSCTPSPGHPMPGVPGREPPLQDSVSPPGRTGPAAWASQLQSPFQVMRTRRVRPGPQKASQGPQHLCICSSRRRRLDSELK